MIIVTDDTPAKIREYWIQQNPDHIKALDDPMYQAERALAASLRNPNDNMLWKQKLDQLDPSHHKAPVPEWVRFAKRKNQGFCCYVLGWHEQDWMVNKQSGEIRQVGILTVDHTLAGANGGLTTDANTMMIAEIANTKKGSKLKSYEEMRQFLHSIYELYYLSEEEELAMATLKRQGIKKVLL